MKQKIVKMAAYTYCTPLFCPLLYFSVSLMLFLMLMMSWISGLYNTLWKLTVAYTVDNLWGSFSRMETLSPWANSRLYRNKALLVVEKDRITECLSKWDIHKSIRWDGINPRQLRELANVTVRLFSVSFERSQWSGEVPDDSTKANLTLHLKKECIED